MRSLRPISFSPRSYQRLTSPSVNLSKILLHPPARKRASCHQRADSNGFSQADINLLLAKQASQAAQSQNYLRAIALLSRLVALEPEKAEHYNNRGLMHYALHQTDQALADYDQAISINPRLDRAFNNRANLYATQHSWGDAISDYDYAIDLNPLNVRARLNQAITFREIGDYEEALVCLDVAMIFQPGNASLYAERGRTYHLDGDWNCAIADYNTALHLQSALSSSQQTANPPEDDALSNRVLKWLETLEPVA